ncbi:MAG: hypothetical protein ACXWR4_12965 [Bdellovibrionota bacterium]
MNNFSLFAVFALITLAAPNAHATKKADDSSEAVAVCSNKEANYEFFADGEGKISYAMEKVAHYPGSKIECEPSHGKGEIAFCQVPYEADGLTLYKGGYAIMHYNMDNDSNNDRRER